MANFARDKLSVAVRGDIPEDAQMIGEVARELGISVQYMQVICDKYEIPVWFDYRGWRWIRVNDIAPYLKGRKKS